MNILMNVNESKIKLKNWHKDPFRYFYVPLKNFTITCSNKKKLDIFVSCFI